MPTNIYEHPWSSKTHYTSLWKSMNYHDTFTTIRAIPSRRESNMGFKYMGGTLVWWFLKRLKDKQNTHEFIQWCLYIQRWVSVQRCSCIHNGDYRTTKANENKRKPTNQRMKFQLRFNEIWNSQDFIISSNLLPSCMVVASETANCVICSSAISLPVFMARFASTDPQFVSYKCISPWAHTAYTHRV